MQAFVLAEPLAPFKWECELMVVCLSHLHCRTRQTVSGATRLKSRRRRVELQLCLKVRTSTKLMQDWQRLASVQKYWE